MGRAGRGYLLPRYIRNLIFFHLFCITCLDNIRLVRESVSAGPGVEGHGINVQFKVHVIGL